MRWHRWPVFRLFLAGFMFSPFLVAEDEWDEQSLEAPGSIIKRFVDPLTRQEHRPIRSLLTSDEEHASSIGPVLSPGQPVYMRYHQAQKPDPDEMNYVLEGGRVFVNFDDPHDLLKMPTVKIRPVDGKTRIPFLVRATLTPGEQPNAQSALYMFLRVPIIFSPRLEIRRVYLGPKKLEPKTTVGPDEACYTILIPLTEISNLPAGQPREVVIEGQMILNDYETLERGQFGDFTRPLDGRMSSIAKMVEGRDVIGKHEEAQIQAVVDEIKQLANTPYQQLVLAHRFTATKISYFQNNMQRTAFQVLAEAIGDCDDYARLLVCLLRGLGIPSRVAIGYLYDFNNMGAHAWVEAALQDHDGRNHWFIVDPTLASASQDKDYFVQFKNRIYLYPLRFDIKVQNLTCDYRAEILLNWHGKDKLDKLPATALPALVNSFNESLQASFGQTVSQLTQQNLLLSRQFLFTPSSPYTVTDHPITPERSHLQLTLDSEERIVAELSVTDDEFGLESQADQQMVGLLKEAYQNLKQVPFKGSEARYCLELAFFRDRYADRLQRVRLRVSRYLVEQHLKTIVDSLRKAGLLMEPEAARVMNLHQVCSGKNMYYLQELARKRAVAPIPPPLPPSGTTETDAEAVEPSR